MKVLIWFFCWFLGVFVFEAMKTALEIHAHIILGGIPTGILCVCTFSAASATARFLCRCWDQKLCKKNPRRIFKTGFEFSLYSQFKAQIALFAPKYSKILCEIRENPGFLRAELSDAEKTGLLSDFFVSVNREVLRYFQSESPNEYQTICDALMPNSMTAPDDVSDINSHHLSMSCDKFYAICYEACAHFSVNESETRCIRQLLLSAISASNSSPTPQTTQATQATRETKLTDTESALQEICKAYAAEEITEEEFDEALDVIMQAEELNGNPLTADEVIKRTMDRMSAGKCAKKPSFWTKPFVRNAIGVVLLISVALIFFFVGRDKGYNNGYDDAYDWGVAVGRNTGYDKGYDKGYDNGYDDGVVVGRHNGYGEGYDDGYDKGHTAGFAAGFIDALYEDEEPITIGGIVIP